MTGRGFSRRPWHAVGPALLLAALACTTGPEASIERLNESRNRWMRQGITDYSVTMQRVCFCGDIRQVRIRVVGEAVTSRVFVDTGEPVPETRASSYPAIPALFDFLESAYRSADRVQTTYDETLGIPLEANIDYAKDAADDELVIRLTDFVRG